MTITEFLLARIAEDEADANGEDEDYADTTLFPTIDSDHQARWHTDRVRAECAAKRAIIDMALDLQLSPTERLPAWVPANGELALRHLAAVYANHPDYRQEWKP